MGCIWSNEGERCLYCERRGNLSVTDNVCVSCQSRLTRAREVQSRREPTILPQHREDGHQTPKYGEYKCSCGRYWNSRLSWPGLYQACKRCKRHVYPHTQRDLRPSDMSNSKEFEHSKELCQMCIQRGFYCGANRLNRTKINSRKW